MGTENLTIDQVKDELQDVALGSSYEKVYQLLYYIALLKYSTQQHLKAIDFPGSSKVATTNKLKSLSKLGYLRSANETLGIYSITTKTLNVLKLAGHNIKLLPSVTKGCGVEIYNTDVFVRALKLPNYFSLLYPQFPKENPYIIPDALLVLKEENRYQLNFLEVEVEKPNWDSHLQTKYEGYKRLSKDIQVYTYWKAMCFYLKLPCPRVENFKFRVIIIGDIEKNWGNGFEFRREL